LFFIHDHYVIISCHLLCIHDIYLVHVHAIGVPAGVTLLEFEGTYLEEQPPPVPEPQVQAPEGVLKEGVADYPDRQPCNFVKGKPRSIISLLISEIN
jgi:hypothetical protein